MNKQRIKVGDRVKFIGTTKIGNIIHIYDDLVCDFTYSDSHCVYTVVMNDLCRLMNCPEYIRSINE